MLVAVWTIAALLGLGVLAAVRVAGRRIVYGSSALLSILLVVSGVNGLTGAVDRLVLPLGLPWTGTHFRLDALSGFFLIIVGLGGAGASIFAIGYGRHEASPRRVLPFYPAFLAALALVVIADDAFSFLFGWELMSLTSWTLVVSHHRGSGNARAGFVYLIMAAFSGMALLLTFGLLAGTGGHYTFDSMRGTHLGYLTGAVALIAALIGAGSKAGLVPLHVWLPLAHPAAPSHVSALMSGVMTKVAVYGFIRIVFDLLGPTAWWTGTVVLIVGGVSAVMGVLHALMERDLKRLLAYSTIENIGIIFVGLGLTLAFRVNGFAAGTAIALTATLFHVLNHTIFKSLLFFGAGSIQHATGDRDIETMGGLIHGMPRTALAFLIGCVAIAGLPPLNGFASEWLLFQAILLRPDLPQWGLKLMIPVDGAMLALAVALAAGCFVRCFGICFLGRPRTNASAIAGETDGWSVSAMLGFATLCLLIGIMPAAVIDALAPVASALSATRMPMQLDNDWLTIMPAGASRNSYNGFLIFAFITGSILITAAVVHWRSHGIRRASAWDCGFPDANPGTQYTAGSFAQPIRRVFGSVVFQARDDVDLPPPGDSRPAGISHLITDPIWEGVYVPLAIAVGWIAGHANRLQFLTIRRYLGFVFAMLVVLLLALTLWQ